MNTGATQSFQRLLHDHLADLLHTPSLVGFVSDWREVYLAGTHVDKRQVENESGTEWRDDLLGEEIACDQRIHLQSNELVP